MLQDVFVQTPGSAQPECYRLLEQIPFTSGRKRMDMILQFPDEPDLVTIMCKGADSFVRDTCLSAEEQESSAYHKTQVEVTQHAFQGLRTLFVAQGKIPLNKFQAWRKEYRALKARDDLSKAEHEAQLEVLEREIENGKYNPKGMRLLGSTALEVSLVSVQGEGR